MSNYEDVSVKSLNFIKEQMNVNKYTLFPKLKEQYAEEYTGRVFGSVEMPLDAKVEYPSYIICDQFYDEMYSGVCSGTHHNVGVARTNLAVEVATFSDKMYVSAVCFLHVDGTWRTETYYKTTEIYGINGVPSRWETFWQSEDKKVNTSGSNAIKNYTLKYYRWADEAGNLIDIDNLPPRVVTGQTLEGQILISKENQRLEPILMDDIEIEDAVPYYPDYVADFHTLSDVEYLADTTNLLFDDVVNPANMPVNPPEIATEPTPFIRDVVFSPSHDSGKLEVAWIGNFFAPSTINVNGVNYTTSSQELAEGYRTYKTTVSVTRGATINYVVSGKGISISGSLDYPISNVYRICGDPQITDEQSALNWYQAQNIPSPFGKVPTLLLSMGDQIDSIINAKLKRKQYSLFSNGLVAPIMVARGNHDRNKTYFAQYSMPNDNIIDGNYYFKHEGILFVVLDTNSDDYVRHMEFIDSVLQSNTFTTSVLVMHHSLYTVGKNAFADNIIGLRKNMADFIQSKPFNIVLSGHDHIYCRTWVGNKLYVVAPSSSGSKYYKVENPTAPWADVYQELNIPCVIDMEVLATAIKLKLIDYNGTILDEVTISK